MGAVSDALHVLTIIVKLIRIWTGRCTADIDATSHLVGFVVICEFTRVDTHVLCEIRRVKIIVTLFLTVRLIFLFLYPLCFLRTFLYTFWDVLK